MKRFEPGDVILKAGEMPDNLMMIASGKVEVLSEMTPFQRAENVFAINKELSSRTATLIQKGEAYGKVFCKQEANGQETYSLIGDECDLLGIVSPYTYIAKERTLIYTCPVEQFYRNLLAQNPDGVRNMKEDASDKLKRYALLVRKRKYAETTVDNGFTDIKAAKEKDD